MTEELREFLQAYGWDAEDFSVFISCCEDRVEPDCQSCPTCGTPNPLFLQGLI